MSYLARLKELAETTTSSTDKTNRTSNVSFVSTRSGFISGNMVYPKAPASTSPASSARQDSPVRGRDDRQANETTEEGAERPPTPQQQMTLNMLTSDPSRMTAFVAGDPEDGCVRVSVALRRPGGNVVGDLLIPAAKWDPWLFLHVLEKQREVN